MEIKDFINNRYTTKVFDPLKKIDESKIKEIVNLLHKSPSSTNSQPWHFIIVKTQEGFEKVAKAATGIYAFNELKIRNASHLVILCTKSNIDESYLKKLVEQEDKDGRFINEDAKKAQHKGRSYFVNSHRFYFSDAQHWMEKQVYIALGTLLFGVSILGIDSCTMEGFDKRILDEELNLHEKGFTSTLIVSLGYRSNDDFNATTPKSRLPLDEVVSFI